ncbi:MAG: YIP1 family protein [candidate division KSB1 bacterium]|nr:YIP1 family protein [candidate division KSB1 bacterium]MDZ7274862.1 YIP1 family protein [candidate division KSB1 bacterium]MDZ7286686.1 YIP1 family protein [candidate division KSB1 bacterium]MDZ7299151.1 YIP1 family protein [candidate division KSB1 bacterium]MDZ7307039.1 YIP1 family protein [candidate division KSB1 bacterium]
MFVLRRVHNLLLAPAAEWQTIRKEQLASVLVYLKYVIWMAALPALGFLLGFWRAHMPVNFRAALLSYLILLIAVEGTANLTHLLAPTFSSRRDLGPALALVAFGFTPVFVAGVLVFLPVLGTLLWVAGIIYAGYVIQLGLPVMLDTPADKAFPFMLAIVAIFAALLFLLALLADAVFASGILKFFGLHG